MIFGDMPCMSSWLHAKTSRFSLRNLMSTDDAKLMRPDLVSRVPEMDLSPHFSTYVDNRVDPFNMDTGVVPATTSPMPKLEWRERY